jgi:leucyl-tRNA synthetase
MAEELWERLGHQGGVVAAGWPSWDDAAVRAEQVDVPVQVNGKLRGRVTVPADTSEEALRDVAVQAMQAHLAGKTIKTVVVARGGRLVNIVAS